MLREQLKDYVSFYNCSFRKLNDTHERHAGEDLESKVDLILTDPPYNIRRTQGKSHSTHDSMSKSDMVKLVDMADISLVPGGQGVIFCSFVQYQEWRSELMSLQHPESDDDADEEDMPSASTSKKKEKEKELKPVFGVENSPLRFTRARGNYMSDPRHLRFNHTCMGEIAVRFWKKGLTKKKMMEKLDYNAGGFIPSTLPGWTDTIDNIPRIPASEIIYRPELLENGKAGRIRPEQKSTALLKTLVAKYCPPGGLVWDPFAGTMSTARACLLLHSHRRCVCTDVDEECVKVSIPSLLDVFASQLLNEDSDITGSEEVLRAARDYTHRRDSIRSRTVRNAWSTPPGMHGMQTFPKDVLEYISCKFEDPKVSVAYRNIPYTSWGATWKVRFNELDPKELIAHQLALNKLYITESTIPNAGKGLFTREAIGPNTFIGYYFRSLRYDNLGVVKTNSHEWHGEVMMAFPLNEFTKWAFKVTQKLP